MDYDCKTEIKSVAVEKKNLEINNYTPPFQNTDVYRLFQNQVYKLIEEMMVHSNDSESHNNIKSKPMQSQKSFTNLNRN